MGGGGGEGRGGGGGAAKTPTIHNLTDGAAAEESGI